MVYCVCFQYVNPAYERLFGYTCDEIIGQDVRDMLWTDKNKPDLQESINAHLKKGKVSILFYCGEHLRLFEFSYGILPDSFRLGVH